MLTLSAPAVKHRLGILRRAHPAAHRERHKQLRRRRRTVSSSVPRPSCVAVMSSSTISSAPAAAWRCASSAGSPASTMSTKLDALDDPPAAHIQTRNNPLRQQSQPLVILHPERSRRGRFPAFRFRLCRLVRIQSGHLERPHSRASSPWDMLFYNSTKFLSTRNPTSADFSGWNCTPITFSRSTAAVNAPP